MTDLTVVETPTDPPKKAEGARAVILAVVVLTILAILLGGGIGFLMSSSIEQNVARKEKKVEAARWAPPPTRYNDDIVLVKLNPITTNLMAPDSIFIKVETSLVVPREVAANAEAMDALSAEISQDILIFLRTVTLAQIQGPAGLQNLREDLNDRVNIRSEGKVRELILETMVVQ
ncbi:flagellar basal body-associated FliL family protein [Pseudochelatococcus sp. B33]